MKNRGKNRRQEGPITAALVRRVRRLTDRNEHLKASAAVAAAVGMAGEAEVLLAIETVRAYAGSTGASLSSIESRLWRDVIARARQLSDARRFESLKSAM